MITDYDFNKTDSTDAKQVFNFLEYMQFDMHAKGKVSTYKTFIKTIIIKIFTSIRSSRTHFCSRTLYDFCNRFRLIAEEQQGGNDTNRFDSEIIATNDKLKENKCFTPAQHNKTIEKFNLI